MLQKYLSLSIKLSLNFSAMPTKLTIHKFDSDIQIQTMKITIDDDEVTPVTYSGWFDSNSEPKQEVKTSRLVVKLVSGKEPNYLNLDEYAKKIEDNGMNNNTPSNIAGLFETQNIKIDNKERSSVKYKPEINTNDMITTTIKVENVIANKCETDFMKSIRAKGSHVSKYPMHSPLEYSLKKVEENNALIMKNIHILNRTLNYTKEREDMDNFSTKPMKTFPCRSCGKCFVYETGLKKHYLVRHSLGEIPRWQVVWTCVECFQVWPRHDLAYKHSTLCSKLVVEDSVKEIKTSLLLQCEFCEKVFTSIPQLLKHLQSHTTNKNYECTPCRMVFISYKEAEQHWAICPFIEMCYGFSLSKMFLCNACDRKFKNYEQLYNHR